MTKPGSTNQVQLSQESANLVNAIAKRAGLPEGTIAANVRVVSRHEIEDRDGVSLNPVTHPEGPVLLISNGRIVPAPSASLQGLRLGMSVHYQNGVADRWTFVARRAGVRLCEIDYAGESRCEYELEALRVCIDSFLVSDVLFSFPTQATEIRNFNPVNGSEL